jgi:glycogen operon protein
VPEALRGTYAGLAHPAAVQHLLDLGVTAVELLPVHHFVSEPHLLRRGLVNHWGYNSLGFLAPHAAYSSSGEHGEQLTEFRSMVSRCTRPASRCWSTSSTTTPARATTRDPTLAWRGLDNAGYYRLQDTDRSRYRDYTGCGNSLDLRDPHALQLVLDSLRYWVTELHVDGFRFDLASTLARTAHDFDRGSAFLQAVHQDPVLSTVKLIAEPWDLGEGGYQVGGFPHPWSEWNDRFRDTVRDAWRGAGGGVRELAYRLSGSSDVYAPAGRSPQRRSTTSPRTTATRCAT